MSRVRAAGSVRCIFIGFAVLDDMQRRQPCDTRRTRYPQWGQRWYVTHPNTSPRPAASATATASTVDYTRTDLREYRRRWRPARPSPESTPSSRRGCWRWRLLSQPTARGAEETVLTRRT